MTLLNPPLSVHGSSILDSTGAAVRLAGVNWGGAHQNGLVPAGLDKLHRNDIAARIAAWGLNHVRLTFAVGTFVNKDGSAYTRPADASRLAANPDLAGSATPLEVYIACAEALMAAGIAVIPNQHMLDPGWCCSNTDANGLWYNDAWAPHDFIAAWRTVVAQFASSPLVIGYDLHNEPRPATIGGAIKTPSWGDGNNWTDFRHMYSDMITNLLPAGDKLYFCEGLNYAGDLTKAGTMPVTGPGPGIVYSMHDYSWFHSAGQSQAEYMTQMDQNGGYLVNEDRAPLWIGEFGIDTGTRANMSTGWMANFLVWVRERGISWCWWELSSQAVMGLQPATGVMEAVDGTRETFGLMAGQDWQGSESEMLALLQPIM